MKIERSAAARKGDDDDETRPGWVIHLIEKTLSLEKYKPWTMGPNGFMGTTLLALQI